MNFTNSKKKQKTTTKKKKKKTKKKQNKQKTNKHVKWTENVAFFKLLFFVFEKKNP